jgi:hypothetical protein
MILGSISIPVRLRRGANPSKDLYARAIHVDGLSSLEDKIVILGMHPSLIPFFRHEKAKVLPFCTLTSLHKPSNDVRSAQDRIILEV